MSQIRIALAEQNPELIHELRTHLQALSYEVIGVACSNLELVKLVSETRPDLLILGNIADQANLTQELTPQLDIPFIHLVPAQNKNSWPTTKLISPFEFLFTPLNERELHLVIEATLYRFTVESKLNKREQRFDQIVSCITDHIYVTQVNDDGQRVNLYLSPHVEPLTGYPMENFMADWAFWPSTVIHPADRASAADQANQLTQGQSHETEYRIVRADGQIIWVRDSGRTERHESTTVVYGVVSDITERKRLEERLRLSQKLEAVGRLAGGIAHDFNNLLTVIIGDCELLLGSDLLVEPLRQDVEEIRKTARSATDLIRHLLAFSRQQVLEPKVVNLNTVVADMHKMLRRLIGHEIAIELMLEPRLGQVKVDPYQLGQVILNLVVNARDAMPNGGRLQIATANAHVNDDLAHGHSNLKLGQYVTLTVSDTGIGMDSETQLHLFEPFFTTKEAGQGTGLGLATVHGIVRQSGGDILFTSNVGKGTTFTVYLPHVAAEVEVVAKERPAPLEFGSETILLVEDDPNVRLVLRKFLQKQGYTVLDAAHGQEALHLCRQHQGTIHLLISDIVMAGVNGRELARQIVQLHPQIKVLLTSGYAEEFIEPGKMVDSEVSFLQKPFTPDILSGKICQILSDIL
jgi:PAS domain S-box-containing protein